MMVSQAHKLTRDEKDTLVKCLMMAKMFAVQFHLNDIAEHINCLLDVFYNGKEVTVTEDPPKVKDCNIPVS